jgi:hypothetical protein
LPLQRSARVGRSAFADEAEAVFVDVARGHEVQFVDYVVVTADK